jgi:diaminopropionate ammonia-lyase
VIEGYSTTLWEIEEQLRMLGVAPPDLVAVQVGVGAFAAAVTRFARTRWTDPRVFILAVEPARAACLLGSMQTGERRKIDAPLDSIMSGLNCGEPSPVAWPVLSAEIDAFVSVDDERARDAMRLLHRQEIQAGECGAASLAGLQAWPELTGKPLPGSRALLISTEGPTDPAAYSAILGR